MTQLPQDNPDASIRGFTIIEVLIVLSIAGLIMVIVFMAVPALQRNSRNQRRYRDASQIYVAITECMALNFSRSDMCNEPHELPLDPATLSIYTGFHYGVATSGGVIVAAHPPTMEEPSWQFGVKCNAKNTTATPSEIKTQHVVSLFLEGGTWGYYGRCVNS